MEMHIRDQYIMEESKNVKVGELASLIFLFLLPPSPPYYEHSFGKSQRSFLLIFFFKWLAFEFDVSSGNKALESRFSTTLAHNIICIILVWDSKNFNLL